MRAHHSQNFLWATQKNESHDYLLNVTWRIMDDLNIHSQSYILDAGCGSGYIMHCLYQKNYTNIVGFDLSESGITYAKTHYPELQAKCFVHDAYIRQLPCSLADGGFDLIISLEVIEHLFAPRAYLENIYAWLKPGGYAIISAPYHGYVKNCLISLLNIFDTHFDPLSETGHVKFFSRKTLCNIVKQAGLFPEGFYGCGGIAYAWHSMAMVAKKI